METGMTQNQRRIWQLSMVCTLGALGSLGTNWVPVLGGTALLGLISGLLERRVPPEGLGACFAGSLPGKLGAVLLLGASALLLGRLALLAELAFPGDRPAPVLALCLLGLSAWAAHEGEGACARALGVLWLFLLVFYSVLLGFSLEHLHREALLPKENGKDLPEILMCLLLTTVLWVLPREEKSREAGSRALLVLLPTALVLVTTGVRTELRAAADPLPLYRLAAGLQVLGLIERMEPILSCALLVGLFSLSAALSCTCRMVGTRAFRQPFWGSLSAVLGAFSLLWRGTERQPTLLWCGTILLGTLLVVVLCRGSRNSA